MQATLVTLALAAAAVTAMPSAAVGETAATCSGFYLEAVDTATPGSNNHKLALVDQGYGYFAIQTTNGTASCFYLNGTNLYTVVPQGDGLPKGTKLFASYLGVQPIPPPMHFFGAYEENPSLDCTNTAGNLHCVDPNTKIDVFQFCPSDPFIVNIGNQTFSGCQTTGIKVITP